MATRTEDFVTIASIIKCEIQKRKKQKIYQDELINCIPISNASAEDETELILLKKKKKKKKEDKKKVQNNKKLKNDKSILTLQKFYTEICDDNDKHLNKDKTEYSNLSKDEFQRNIPIPNTSEGDSLFKKKKKKKKGDQKMVQNDNNFKNDIATLKVEKFYTENCNDNNKHLIKEKIGYSNLSKDEFQRNIAVANNSEGDSLFNKKKKKKKKKGDKKMVQNYENMNNDIFTLKVDKLNIDTCDDGKHLYKDETMDNHFNKDKLKRRISIGNASEGDLLLKKRKKKKKEDIIMVQNNENMNNDIVTLNADKFYIETCDDNNKHLIKEKIGYSNLCKDEFQRNIAVANNSEGDSLFNKKKKKKKKGDKKMVQNNENMNNDIVTLNADKFYIETCDDNNKHLIKEKIGYSNLCKDEFQRNIAVANNSEGDYLFNKKKKKKKKGDKKMVQNYENMNNDNFTLKVDKLNIDTCDDDKHLYKDKTMDNHFNKDKLKRRISIGNASEGNLLFRKKKKKKNGDKKMVQKDKFLKNDKATLKVEQLCNETCDNNVKYLNKINKSASNLNKGLTTKIQIANAPEDDEGLTLLKSPSKKSKKKKKKSKMTIKEDNESSKYESIQKNLKNMEDLKKYISEEQSNEIHNDPAMINIPCNSRISKVHEEEYPDLFQKLFKNKKKDKKKSIKAATSEELVSPKKLNKRKRQTTDREYSKNDSLQSVDMDVESYYDSNNSIDDTVEKKLELFDSLDDHTSEYRTMTDTDSTMINTSYNSRISKVCDEGYPELFHKLLKNKKRDQKKVIKAVTSKEIMSRNKLNKPKQSASDKEYSKNDSPQSVAMVMETYDSNNYIGEDGRKKLEFFDPRDDYTSEYRTMTDMGIYFARYCNQTFNNVNDVHSHKNVLTGKTPLQCDVCFRTFSCKSKLHIHKRTHTGEKPYACDVCGNSFSHKSTLVSHKRTHTGEKPFACNFCGRSFSKQGNLVVHKRTHTGEKPYSCNVCCQSFSHKSTLVSHKRTHTGEKPHACNFCGRSFSKQGNLVVHKRTHTGEKPYSCNVCCQSFSHKSTLVSHKRTHTGEKPHACNFCGRSFSKQGHLVVHKRTHTGEKPYSCNVCCQSFSHKSTLVSHKRTHTGEKPYSCNVCCQSFSHKSTLVSHKRTHTGEKPHACNFCGRSFSKQGNLVVHKRTHTGERPYECGQCEKKFAASGDRAKHERRVHIKCF